jgi:outer membrane lipoprotein-sorting protein
MGFAFAVRSTILAVLAVSVCGATAGFASGEPALERFSSAVNAVQDYTGVLTTHEVDGTKTEDRVMDVWFKKPSMVKVAVVGGTGKGGVVVWDGGPNVRGHEGGMLKFITLTLALHNPRVSSMRGATIENGTFTWQVQHLRTVKGKMSEEAGPVVDGSPTDIIIVDGVDPATEQGMTKEMFFISRKTGLLSRFQGYDGAALVRQSDYTDVKVNSGLTDADFKL